MNQYPKLGEFVLVKVKKILNYGAFCSLIEYDNKEAFLHISEVAPRWIKNIHEFLHEGQTLVARVIKVDEEKDHIDVSIKKVSEYEAKNKIKLYRQEKRAAKIFELFVKEAQLDGQTADKIKSNLIEHFGSLFDSFSSIAEEEKINFKKLGIEENLGKKLLEIVSKNIKKSEARLKKFFSLVSYAPNGIEFIKKALKEIENEKTQDCTIEIDYLGAPNYQIVIKSKDAKAASKLLDKIIKKLENFSKENNLIFSVQES